MRDTEGMATGFIGYAANSCCTLSCITRGYLSAEPCEIASLSDSNRDKVVVQQSASFNGEYIT